MTSTESEFSETVEWGQRVDPSFVAATLDEPPEFLLLDPSLFLGDEGFQWLADVGPEQRARFMVPVTFIEQVAGRTEYTKADWELWGPLPEGATRADLAEILAGLAVFSGEDVQADLSPEVAAVADRIRDMGSQVAVEEWLYLQSHSWLAARSRRILDHFARAGAKGVELAGRAIDDVTWLALGTRPDSAGRLTPGLRARAGVNVVIVGGVAAVGVLVPWLTIPGAVVGLLLAPLARPKSNPAAT